MFAGTTTFGSTPEGSKLLIEELSKAVKYTEVHAWLPE